MNIEYSFVCVGDPFQHKYKCQVDVLPDFSQELPLEFIMKILKRENVNIECIMSIYVYRESEKVWTAFDNNFKDFGWKNLKLKIVMAKFSYTIELIKMLNLLKSEVQSLKELFLSVSNKYKLSTSNNIYNKDSLLKSKSILTNPSTPLLQRENTSSTFIESRSVSERYDIDIAYLYAVPIVKEVRKKLSPLSNPIDAFKEIESILTELKTINKRISIKVNVGTFDQLRNSIALRPKILHISCHGGYEMESGTPKLYLYLERNDMNGAVEKYDVTTFRQWFKAELRADYAIRPRLVFVSACYSQAFGEALRQAGVPNVIAINSDTQVADEAATRFAKVLYHYLTLGMSVKKAFEQTKKDGKVSLRRLRLCCCTHNHKEDCGLLTELVRNRDEAHAKHTPECRCDFGGNIHLKTCRWTATMSELSYEVKPVKDDPRKVRVCCCNPDLPHNEEEKFLLISQNSEAQGERLLENLLEAEPIVIRCFNPEILPIDDEQLIGRNIELHRLLTLLISKSYEHRIISVNGPKGVGKTLLTMTAAKYAIERGIFPDGAVTIELSSLTWFLSKLNTKLLPPPYKEARNLSELGIRLKGIKKIVIMRCSGVVERNFQQLVKYLRIILAEGSCIRFLILGKKKICEEYAVNLSVEENLTPLSAFIIIKRNNPDWTYTYGSFETTDLANVLTTPWLAKKAAYMLKTDSPDEVYSKLLKEKLILQHNNDSISQCDEYVKSEEGLFKSLNNACDEMMPIYILAQLQFGMLESDLKKICEEEFSKWKEKVMKFINETNGANTIIICSEVEEIKENKYILTEIASKYVNEYLLNKNERIKYQILCLKFLSSMARKLVCSYNVNVYKKLDYNEFTAIINEAIWSSPIVKSNSLLPSNPIKKFHLAKDNFLLYLDSEKLQEMANEVKDIDVDINKLLRNAKELALCTFTMLVHTGRPQEALGVADSMQTFVAAQNATQYRRMNRQYRDINGMMQLLKSGLTFKEPDIIGVKDALRQAEEAETSFRNTENDIGLGEALFLQGLLVATEKDKRKYVPAIFQDTKAKFVKYSVGVARVNIAEAGLLIEESDECDKEIVEQLLDEALKILETKDNYKNMQGRCYYLKAMCAEKHKNYDTVRENLLLALGKVQNVRNDKMESIIKLMLNHSSSCIQQEHPLFVFLESFPLVKKLRYESLIALEPLVRKQNSFRNVMLEYFESRHLAIKIHFDVLTRDNIRRALVRSCVLLHISSSYNAEGILAFEDSAGEADEMCLHELKSFLVDYINVSQCKLVVIILPNSKEIAQVFTDLGVPHVICFCLTRKYFCKYEEKIPSAEIHKLTCNTFGEELYKLLMCGETIRRAFEKALNSAIAIMKNVLQSFGVEDFVIENYSNIANIYSSEKDELLHNVKLIPVFKFGKCIETSPKRGICDIEQDKKPLVGRQLEFFKIVSSLMNNRCVNLYGNMGMGKTKLAKEIAYFLYMRSWFLSGIYYRGDMQHLYNSKYFIPLETKKYTNSWALLIVDNLNQLTWIKTEDVFALLKRDRKCLFLFISQEPLLCTSELRLTRIQLNPLNEKESLAFVMMYLERSNTFKTGIASLKLSNLKKDIMNASTFKQANGCPNLLKSLCKELLEGLDTCNTINPTETHIKRNLVRYESDFDVNSKTCEQSTLTPNKCKESDETRGIEREKKANIHKSFFSRTLQNNNNDSVSKTKDNSENLLSHKKETQSYNQSNCNDWEDLDSSQIEITPNKTDEARIKQKTKRYLNMKKLKLKHKHNKKLKYNYKTKSLYHNIQE